MGNGIVEDCALCFRDVVDREGKGCEFDFGTGRDEVCREELLGEGVLLGVHGGAIMDCEEGGLGDGGDGEAFKGILGLAFRQSARLAVPGLAVAVVLPYPQITCRRLTRIRQPGHRYLTVAATQIAHTNQ